MRTYLDCYPCLLRQALDAARMGGANELQQHRALQGALQVLAAADLCLAPPQIGQGVHRAVREITGVADPYAELKWASTQHALELYPRLLDELERATDPFNCAVRLAIAGNIIDYGAPSVGFGGVALWATVERVLVQPFAREDLAQLRAELARAHSVLYLADNAGETVFDRLLIGVLPCPVTYVVKGGPALNDATLADAQAAGLEPVCTLMSNGVDAPGTLLHACSPTFRQAFEQADVVIAKGQGNYETLANCDRPVYMLLQCKCAVIARDLGVPLGSIVAAQLGAPQSHAC